MLRENQQIRTLAIIIIGQFNPAIIQPFWLAKKGLIKEPEAENAVIEIVHPQLTRLDINWVSIEVSNDRFSLKSSDETMFEAVKDLMEGIFTCLPETPVTAFGINHIIHYLIANNDQYKEFGNRLAPFNNWDGILENPRMLQLQIIEQKRKDKLKGHFVVNIQPSDQLNGRNGIVISFNDHVTLEEREEGTNKDLLEKTNQIWTPSFNRVDETVDKLWQNLKL